MDRDTSNNYHKEKLDALTPQIINNLKIIKLAQEAGIFIDGEYKNQLSKIVKQYLIKSNSFLEYEISYSREYEKDSCDEVVIKRENEKYFGEE